jgi:hypothetical protein
MQTCELIGRTFTVPLVCALAAVAALGCGQSKGPSAQQGDTGTSDAGNLDGAAAADSMPGPSEAGSDAESGDGAMDAGTAIHFPQMVSLAVALLDASGPAVLSSPEIVPVFFADDDGTTPGQVTAFLSALVTSPYWAGVVSEYGVGSASVLAPVSLTAADNPPSTIDDSQIQPWLMQKIGEADGGLPPSDENTLYALFYPAGTTVTQNGVLSSGYHSNLGNTPVPYAVLPRLAVLSGSGPVGTLSLTGLDALTFAATHELVEAATDPVGGGGYFGFDAAHAYWFDFLEGELADACQYESPTTLGTYTVPRIWSNMAAAAGSDPCVPAPADQAYFNSAALFGTNVSWRLPFLGAPSQVTQGVHIPVGGSATVDIEPFSTGATPGAWSVSARDLASLTGGQPQLQFTFDQTSAQVGVPIHMTIQVLSAGNGNIEEFEVLSTLGSQTHYWFGIVGN